MPHEHDTKHEVKHNPPVNPVPAKSLDVKPEQPGVPPKQAPQAPVKTPPPATPFEPVNGIGNKKGV